MNLTKISDPIYRTKLEVLVGSPQDLKEYLTFHQITLDDEVGSESGRFIRVKPGDSKGSPDANMTIIWLKDNNIPVLVHEISHHIIRTFDENYIPINEDNTEVFSYYIEMLTELILEAWKPKKKKKP